MILSSPLYKKIQNFVRHSYQKDIDGVEDRSSYTRLSISIFWLMFGTIISRGIRLCAMIFVARFLGRIVYGEFGMIQSTAGMLGIFAGFGLGITSTKYVAEFRKKEPERAARIITLTSIFSFFSGGMISLLLFFSSSWISGTIINAPHLSNYLRIGALILFLNALNGAQTGALSGFEAFKDIAYVNVFSSLISFPIILAGTYFYQLSGSLWAIVFSLSINLAFNHLALRNTARKHNVTLSVKGCQFEWKILGKFSVPAVISASMVGPVFWLCKSILANQPDGYAGLGIFTVAENWREILIFACSMVTQASFPILACLYGEGKRRSFQKMLFSQFYINGSIVFLGVIVISLFSNFILSMYGSDYNKYTIIFVLMIVSALPMQLATVAGMVNKCVGNIWWGVLLNGLWAIIYIFFTLHLVHLGVFGLACSTIIAYSFHLVFTMGYVMMVFRTSHKLLSE